MDTDCTVEQLRLHSGSHPATRENKSVRYQGITTGVFLCGHSPQVTAEQMELLRKLDPTKDKEPPLMEEMERDRK